MDGVDVASMDSGSVAEVSEPPAFGAIVEGAIDDLSRVSIPPRVAAASPM